MADKTQCKETFSATKEAWRHSREHGPEYFPWVCRICRDPKFGFAMYVTETGFKSHWYACHSEVKETIDIIHPAFGNHYSQLSPLVK